MCEHPQGTVARPDFHNERDILPACGAGSGGMEQPDRLLEGGVTLPRLRELRGLRDAF
jgi:hypothetical protein